jgi:F-type H+-transporting ATPase subunit a
VRFLADVTATHQDQVTICSGGGFFCTINPNSIVSTVIAMAVVLVLAFWARAVIRHGRPGKLQMVFESVLAYARNLIHDNVAGDAMFIVPIAVTIGTFILVANWLDFFPLAKPVIPANSDWNITLAMALVVFLIVQGYCIKATGVWGFFYRFTKPFDMNIVVRILFIPLNVLEEVLKPVTLSLRLFGNIFAGAIMVQLIGALPIWASVPTMSVWKAFDVFFIGSLQALIFMLLTIIYFGMAREALHAQPHGEAAAGHH